MGICWKFCADIPQLCSSRVTANSTTALSMAAAFPTMNLI